MFMPRHQNAEQDPNITIANKSFEKCGKVKIFGNDSSKSKLNSRKKLRSD